MRRISVVGNSGAGKTTLARALADRFGVVHVEVDALYHGLGWTEPEPEVFPPQGRRRWSWVHHDGYHHRYRQAAQDPAHAHIDFVFLRSSEDVDSFVASAGQRDGRSSRFAGRRGGPARAHWLSARRSRSATSPRHGWWRPGGTWRRWSGPRAGP